MHTNVPLERFLWEGRHSVQGAVRYHCCTQTGNLSCNISVFVVLYSMHLLSCLHELQVIGGDKTLNVGLIFNNENLDKNSPLINTPQSYSHFVQYSLLPEAMPVT